MKERETKDDQYALPLVRESSLVSQGITSLPSFLYSEFNLMFFSFCLTALFLCVCYSFYDWACSSLSQRK